MDKEIADQIKELRKKGLGYKTIGLVVGLSRDTVRYFIKSQGIDCTPDE